MNRNMAEILLLRLDQDCTSCSWQRIDRLGNLLGPAGTGDLTQAAANAGDARVEVLLPQELLQVVELELPTTRRRQAEAAAAFAFEDKVLDAMDGLHHARPARPREGRWPQAAISRVHMDQLMASLAAAGITPRRLIPESELLPRDDALQLLWETGRVLARAPDGRVVICPPEQVALVLPRLLGEDARIHALIARGTQVGGLLEGLAAQAELTRSELDQATTAWFAERLRGERDLLDLRQGDYRLETGRSDHRRWLPVGIAAALLSVVQLGIWIAEVRGLEAQHAQLLADMQRTYEAALPGSRFNRFQARQVMERAAADAGATGTARGSDDFLGLLSAVAAAQAEETVRLDGLSFQNGTLELRLRADDLQVVQRMVERIAGRSGASVTIGDVDTTEAGVRARLTLRRTGVGS